MADYEIDFDNNINDINKKRNYLEHNDKNSTQYIIAAHLSNISFIYLLIEQNTPLLNEACTTQYFVLEQYAKTIF